MKRLRNIIIIALLLCVPKSSRAQIEYIGSTLWAWDTAPTMQHADIHVVDDYAYCVFEAGLKIFDISDPNRPTYVGQYYTGNANGIFVDGNYAYMVDGQYGLEIIDIGNCVPQTGACCIDNVCEFTSEEQPCLEAGGTWYEGETCPEFQCPIDPCENAIWHNGEPDGSNGFVCDRRSAPDDLEAWVVADAAFPYQVRIGSLHWWSVTDDDYYWQETGDFIILEDAGDEPGDEIYEEFDVPNTRFDTGEIMFGRHVYVYTLEVDITLPAGTYWFGMRPVNQGTAGKNFWLTVVYDPYEPPLFFRSEYLGEPDWVPGCVLFNGCFDAAFCIIGWEGPGLCEYIPGDCDHNGVPLELVDVIAMVGMYRGSVMPPYECSCPPNGDNFTPTADPNGNCVANELTDVITEIGAYRGTIVPSGCPDCPGSGRLFLGGYDQPLSVPSLESKTRIRNFREQIRDTGE